MHDLSVESLETLIATLEELVTQNARVPDPETLSTELGRYELATAYGRMMILQEARTILRKRLD
jgi:hypothetical protein